MTVTVRAMSAVDADAVLAIYQIGLDSGDASFEGTAPSWAAYDRAKLPGHGFVATDALGTVVGWTAASPVSARPVYRGVVERRHPAHGNRWRDVVFIERRSPHVH
jgi:phosphinothricin acetyltransferase